MRKYRTLVAWQRARQLALSVLKSTDGLDHPRSRAIVDQLRRAAVSVEANIVEGYALGTAAQFKRHLRIALGSVAETEILDRKSTRLNSSHGYISYAVFCLKKKKKKKTNSKATASRHN